MSIITDNSTPLPLNSPQNLQMINTVNTNMQSFINSNMLSNVSNLLINNINTKQPILTAATNLLGVGSAITAIDWTKITLNKPTDFQANWNTTVINKPTDFQANWNTTVINKPTDFQANWNTTVINKPTNFQSDWSSTIINKPTNFQADWLTTVINKPTYIAPLSSNLATNQISISLANYSTTGTDTNYVLKSGSTMTGNLTAPTINGSTALQEAGVNLTSKYLQLAGGTLPTGSITLTAGTFTGIHSGNGAGLTALTYGNITGVPDFLLKSGGTMTGALNATTINTTGNVGIGITNPFAPLTIGSPAVVGSDGFLVIAKNNSGNRNFKIGYDNAFSMCFGDFGNSTGTNTWNSTDFNIRYFDGNIGMGVAASASYKLNVNGTTYFNGNSIINGACSATTFSGNHTGNGSGLTNLPLSAYSTTGNDANYLLKTGGAMTGQITGVTTLNGTTGIFSTVSTTNNTNANTPQLGAFGGTGDRFILYVGTASLYPYSLGINSDVLWYSVPATASHIFYVGGSPKATISSTGLSITGTISEGGTLLTSKYLQLSGGTLTGNLTVNADLILKNSVWHRSIDGVYRFYYGLNDVSYYCCGGGLADGHIFMDSAYNHRFKIKNNGNIEVSGTISEAGTLLTSKYLQLTGGNMTGTLNLLPTTGITPLYIYSTAAASINNIELKNNANNSCYIGIGGTSYTGYYVNNLFLQSPNSLILNTGNQGTSSTPKMIINNSGNVGIATTNPNNIFQVADGARLRISNGVNDYSLIGTKDVDDNTNTRIVVSGNTRGGYAGQIQYLATAGDHIFYTSAVNERMRILNNGTVNIVNTLQVAGNDINNYLFNNTGRNHATYQDINAIDKFGYTFIQNSTNGPGTSTSYYSWYIGLGNEYPFANSVNGYYGMQFAIGRSETYPKLSVRRKEANVWTGWEGLTAERAVSLTAGDKTISGELTANQSYLGGLRINGGDGNTLYNYGRDLGLLVNSGQSINFSMWGGNGNIMTVNNSGVVIDVDGVPINITNKGIVIGTFTTQYYPFVVSRTINGTLSYVYVRTGWNGGSDYNTNSYTGDTSAVFAGQIHVAGNILNSSDIRIKKEINDITDDAALQQILAIEPKTYKYIDYLSKGNSNVYGFIAQQVKEVIPHAVEIVKDIIPNIYKRASCDSNIITLENDVSQDLNINDNIKIYDEFGNDNMYNITEINSNVIKIDKDINTSNVFVFGKEIEDFHTLKKDYIFTLNVCATQELYKLIQKQNEVIEELRNRISVLENN